MATNRLPALPTYSVTQLVTARRKPVTNVSRIAWVVGVGASRGLGAASARRFAREGYKVAVTGRSPDALQVIVDEIMAAGGQAIQQPVTLSKRVKWLIFSTGW